MEENRKPSGILPLSRLENNVPKTCAPPAEKPPEKMFAAMGTIMHFTASGAHAEAVLEQAEGLTLRLDELLSNRRPDSDITQLNRWNGRGWYTVSEETDDVLRRAVAYAQNTDGVYDPVIGTLTELWRRSGQLGRVPEKHDLVNALLSCGYQNLETDGKRRYRLHHGAEIDLGGIGKGYAADLLYELCRNKGIDSALFSLGTSSMAAVGTRPGGGKWKIGLKAVDSPQSRIFGVLSLQDQWISTSGDDVRFFEADGQTYHHLLDPKTGFPANGDLRCVTLIGTSGTMSEAYSTALYMMGLKAALQFHKKQNDFEAIFVTSEKRVICTPGARDAFEFRGEALGYRLEEPTDGGKHNEE